MAVIKINDENIEFTAGQTILEVARESGIYIPTLCSHPDLKPFHSLELSEKVYQGDNVYESDPDSDINSIKGCGVCIVEVQGETSPMPSCKTVAADGMIIKTDTADLKKKRIENLIPIFAKHPHSCLTCSQREGCISMMAKGDCSNSVPFDERCCELNGICELQDIGDYIGIAPETPKYHHENIPRIEDGNLFIRDYNLCISCGRCVRACQQLRGVYAMGAVINDEKLIIGSVNGPKLLDAECRFCGACVQVCPTGALQDQQKPRLKEFADYVPCKGNCPGDVEIPAYLKLIADGNVNKAAEVISSRLSFPNSLGKVCFHPCETDCRRDKLSTNTSNESGSLSIRAAKDFAMSNYPMPDTIKTADETGKHISIIGAGPAGLTAGFYLSLKGHKVTVYEKESFPGGMLRYGIPRYRLPIETLDKDIDWLRQTGMEIKTDTQIGKDISISSIFENSCDALYISAGLSKSRMLPIDVPEHDDILYGIEFLNQTAKDSFKSTHFNGEELCIIGGGNVATDAARTAIRLGAKSVTLVCLEKDDEMPAYKQEIEEALEEGISIRNEWGIDSVEPQDQSDIDIKLKKCISLFDDERRFSPKYDDSINDIIKCDTVVICVGQQADLDFIVDELNISKNGLIRTNAGTTATNNRKIFAGGDIALGPGSVIDAVGSGKTAAREIDEFLGGDGIISGDEGSNILFNPIIGKINGFAQLERIPNQLEASDIRRKNFDPVEFVYDKQDAESEAGRCLQCNLRLDIGCNPHPPELYLAYKESNLDKVPASEGVVQLLDKEKEVFLIKGTDDMRETLSEFMEDDKEASYFIFEADLQFSQRESELLQQYLQKHGEMPDSGDDLDDLF